MKNVLKLMLFLSVAMVNLSNFAALLPVKIKGEPELRIQLESGVTQVLLLSSPTLQSPVEEEIFSRNDSSELEHSLSQPVAFSGLVCNLDHNESTIKSSRFSFPFFGLFHHTSR